MASTMARASPLGASRGLGVQVLVCLAMIFFAVSLASTARLAVIGRADADRSIQASGGTIEEVQAVHKLLVELRQQLEATKEASVSSTNRTGTNVLHQLQDVRQHLLHAANVTSQTSTVAAALLEHATQMGQGIQALQQHVDAMQGKVAARSAPPAPAAAAARVEDKELHHIATHGDICDKGAAQGIRLNVTQQLVAPLVVMAHARPDYLAKAMVILYRYWSLDPANAVKFPLFISVDGSDQRTLVTATAIAAATGAQVITRRRTGGPRCQSGDCQISQHYKLVLSLFMKCLKAPGLIFLEEDLEVAPDFFSYFEATSRLMAVDPTILCVSAWNDHGHRGRVKDHTALYRTDIMPGLGWYLNAAIGLELAHKWPMTNWDDWMRMEDVRKDRSCIFPEVSRTFTYGRRGVHAGPGFDEVHGKVQLNTQPVNWMEVSMPHLKLDIYTATLKEWVRAAQPFKGSLDDLEAYCAADAPEDTEETEDMVVRYTYTPEGWANMAKRLKPMRPDMREGVPRGAFQRTIMVRCRGRRLFLTPTE